MWGIANVLSFPWVLQSTAAQLAYEQVKSWLGFFLSLQNFLILRNSGTNQAIPGGCKQTFLPGSSYSPTLLVTDTAAFITKASQGLAWRGGQQDPLCFPSAIEFLH